MLRKRRFFFLVPSCDKIRSVRYGLPNRRLALSKTVAGIHRDSLATTARMVGQASAIEISILSSRNFVSCVIDRFVLCYRPCLADITLDFYSDSWALLGEKTAPGRRHPGITCAMNARRLQSR